MQSRRHVFSAAFRLLSLCPCLCVPPLSLRDLKIAFAFRFFLKQLAAAADILCWKRRKPIAAKELYQTYACVARVRGGTVRDLKSGRVEIGGNGTPMRGRPEKGKNELELNNVIFNIKHICRFIKPITFHLFSARNFLIWYIVFTPPEDVRGATRRADIPWTARRMG